MLELEYRLPNDCHQYSSEAELVEAGRTDIGWHCHEHMGGFHADRENPPDLVLRQQCSNVPSTDRAVRY